MQKISRNENLYIKPSVQNGVLSVSSCRSSNRVASQATSVACEIGLTTVLTKNSSSALFVQLNQFEYYFYSSLSTSTSTIICKINSMVSLCRFLQKQENDDLQLAMYIYYVVIMIDDSLIDSINLSKQASFSLANIFNYYLAYQSTTIYSIAISSVFSSQMSVLDSGVTLDNQLYSSMSQTTLHSLSLNRTNYYFGYSTNLKYTLVFATIVRNGFQLVFTIPYLQFKPSSSVLCSSIDSTTNTLAYQSCTLIQYPEYFTVQLSINSLYCQIYNNTLNSLNPNHYCNYKDTLII